MKLKLNYIAALAAFAVCSGAAKAETYALMIGINDYPDVVDADGNRIKDENGNLVEADLSGAVNDVKRYQDIFVNKFGVKTENIKLLLDKQAGENGFVDGMKWLLQTAKAGDNIIFIYSGHGAQIPTTKPEEEDKKDEVIVLTDDKLVPDDLFADIAKMFSKNNVNSTFIFDSCFSGGMSRPMHQFSYEGKPGVRNKKFIDGAVAKNFKYVPDVKLNEVKMSAKQGGTAAATYAFLFAGKEDQPTTDLDFKDPETPDHGLFTLVVTTLLDAAPDAPIEEMMTAVIDFIKEKGFDQVPTFELSAPDRGKKPLIG
jgi:hypothetical protein